MRLPGPHLRSAFTLIELLVVIAIIGILAGLILVAVGTIGGKGSDVADASEITQMASQIETFNAKYKVYPPSKIILLPNRNYYNPAIPLHRDSLYYIDKFWNRLNTKKPPVPVDTNSFYYEPAPAPAQYQVSNYQWIPGVATPAAGYLLEGDQCLVFFLGGPAIFSNGVWGMEGFSNDSLDPCRLPSSGTEQRTKFFTFPSKRLKDRVGNGFPSFLNNWDQTANYYVYFSSGKGKNGYHSGGVVDHTIVGLDNVTPYYEYGPAVAPYGITNYQNPTKFQIISAGKDGRFAEPALPALPTFAPTPGAPKLNVKPERGTWSASAAGLSSDSDAKEFWKDNRANFTPNQLQVP